MYPVVVHVNVYQYGGIWSFKYLSKRFKIKFKDLPFYSNSRCKYFMLEKKKIKFAIDLFNYKIIKNLC